jgi:hypothetical protein
MKKRAFPTIAVLVVFVLLFIYANKYESDEIPEPGKDKPVQLAKVTASEVEALVWKTEGQPEIRVAGRQAGTERKFSLTAPRALPADDDEINGIIRSFNDLKSEYTIAAQATDTAMYGLGPKSPTLTITTASGSATYRLGDNAPVGGAVYFQKEGDPAVYFVPAFVTSAFRKNVDDLRTKRVFPEEFGDVGTLTVELNGEKIALVRGKGLEWQITAPRALPADTYEVSGLITGVQTLKTNRFIEGEPAEKGDFGLATGTFKVTLETASGPVVLLTGRTEGSETYVKRGDSPVIYAVSESSLALLRKDLNKLRSKELPRLDETRLTEVVLHQGTGTWRLTPASDTWECGPVKVETSKVRGLGLAYLSNHVKTFLPASARADEGLKNLAECAWMELKTPDATRKVYFGKGNGTEISIMLEGEDEVYQIPVQTYDTFKSLVDLVSAPPPPPPAPVATATPATGSAAVSPAPASPSAPAAPPAPASPPSPAPAPAGTATGTTP